MRSKDIIIHASYLALLLLTSFAVAGLLSPVKAEGGGDIVVSNSSQVSSVTSATASTGGNSAGAGQNVTTGPSNVSVHVNNTINDGQDGGTSHVEIETTSDRVTHSEVYDKKLAPGESVNIEVATSSSSTKTRVHVKTETKVKGSIRSSTSTTAGITQATSTTQALTVPLALSPAPGFFGKFFTALHGFVSIFWFW